MCDFGDIKKFLSSPSISFYNKKTKDMTWNPNSEKHKAMHGGYRKKPTKSAVLGLLSFYSGISCSSKLLNKTVALHVDKPKVKLGVQLKFNF